MREAVMVADGVSFRYGSRLVVDRLNIAVHTGAILGIVGPNGAGKSTLLKGFSGVLRPVEGHIWLRDDIAGTDIDIAHMSRGKLARLIAVVPQNSNLPETFTALEIVQMGRMPHLGLLQSEGPRDVGVVWRSMMLTDTLAIAERRIGELSGGERQRVLIARALTQEARVLLLDEPTTHLDIGHQVAALDLIARLHREEGLAVVAVFHDLNLAAQYCDSLIMLSGGRIWAQGPPSEVINPSNVADVFGTRVCVLPHPLNGLPMTVTVSGGSTAK